VAWAPSCGRSFHLVATGGRDGHVRIWRIKPGTEDEPDEDLDESGSEARWTATIVADFDHHKCVYAMQYFNCANSCMNRSAVGRVEWNITGSGIHLYGSKRTLIYLSSHQHRSVVSW
jgi:nucleoporin SEH1